MEEGCLSNRMLIEYLDAELDAARTAVVEEHLVICSSCSERLDRYRIVDAAIRRHVAREMELGDSSFGDFPEGPVGEDSR